MSITSKKIINSLLLIALVALIAALAYRFTGGERRLLMGSIIIEGADPGYINSIEFADPSGTAFPVNNEVTINSVYVDFKECSDSSFQTSSTCPPTSAGCSWTSPDCTGDLIYDDGILEGANLISSFVIFDSTSTDAVITNNEIIVPDTFDDFDLNIYLPGYTIGTDEVNTTPLNISSVDCSYLGASLMMATGEGVFTGDPSTLPDPAVSETFDFAQTASVGQGANTVIDFADLYSDSRNLKQLIIENPVDSGTTLGSKPFTLTVDFITGVCTGDPGCEVHTTEGACDAESTLICVWSPLVGHDSNVCTGDLGCEAYTDSTDCGSTTIDTLDCTWSLCDMDASDGCHIVVGDDTTNITTIAQHFVDAIEDMPYSAFDAFPVGTVVTLTAIEEGVHTNAYTYTAVFDNLSAQECDGLVVSLCDGVQVPGCEWNVAECTGDTTADCEDFQSNQTACENADITGCSWTIGGACSGDFDSCSGLDPAICATIQGCNAVDCTGIPSCVDAPLEGVCFEAMDCTWNGCIGEAGCEVHATESACNAEIILLCSWEGCGGTPVCDDFVDGWFDLCIMADACTPTYPCDGTLSTSCGDFSDTSNPTCAELGCDWVPGGCTGTPCDGLDDTDCLSLTDLAECTWDGTTCSMTDHPEFTLTCSDLGGCFADGVDADPLLITNITLINTPANPLYDPAHQTFNLVIDFDTTITGQAVQVGDIITVKDEGLDTQATALNFAYVFNTLLGVDSPFFASFDPLNTSGVILTTRELGLHTNNYTCNVNALPFPDSTAYCFSGGLAGTADVLVAPTTLDNSITQGDVVLVYASGSIGDNIWLSSDPSIIEVAPLNEIGDIMDGSSASFLEAPLAGTDDIKVDEGTYTLGAVQVIDHDPDPDENIYPVTMTIPVEYDVSSSLSTLVTVGATDYPVPVDVVGKLYGNLTGSGDWSSLFGLNIELTGTLSGIVEGYASGDVEGMVHGSVAVDVTTNAQLAFGFPITSLGVGTNLPTVDPVSPDGLIQSGGTFTSTVTEVQEISTDIAVLYAKRPGDTLLTVTDAHNCTATLSVTTVPLEVILQMASADPSDIFDVGDDVQINAYIGTAGGDFSTMDEITSSSQIEWFSGNSVVADFTANDGLLSILAPGTTNVTAHYDTGQTEIGTIESDIMPIVVDKIEGLTITLNEATQAAMPAAEKALGYQNVYLEIHNPQAVGSSVTVEGQNINIVLPTAGEPYANDLEKVSAIAESIAIQIPSTVTVTQSTTYPGVLSLLAHSSNTNGIVDISSTAPVEKATIVPNFGNNIVLPPSKTYGLMVVAEYQSGKTKRLDPGSVNWINNPLNLDDTKLLTGLLESVVYEDSTVKAEFVNADTSTADSNVLTITVHSGPVIEFVRRIGTGSILGGDTVDLQVKVTDVDTIADIAELNVLLAKSAYDTYDDIIANPVDYFSVESYLVDVVVEEELDGTVTPVPEPSFKTYEIPVYILQSTGLFDGDYRLLIEITDASSNVVRAVYPIYIGEIASGDVNGDGNITMIDVYFAFQIYSGAVTATQAQLEAANMDGVGDVTLADVILLFQQVSAT